MTLMIFHVRINRGAQWADLCWAIWRWEKFLAKQAKMAIFDSVVCLREMEIPEGLVYAEVVKLVDTLCSGRSVLTGVGVRLPPSA